MLRGFFRAVSLSHSRARAHRHTPRLSTYAANVLHDLILDEPCAIKQDKLKALQALWEQANEHAKTLQTQAKTLQTALDALVENSSKVQAALNLEILRVKGLNDTRGLFEYLRDKLLAKYPMVKGARGSEGMWQSILRCDPQLVLCLRQHLRSSSNLEAHLASMYHILSQHVHAGKDLTVGAGTIIFQPDFLSPEQCCSLVCLGVSAGVTVAPAPRGSISDS